MLIQLPESLHGNKHGFRRGVENLVFDKANDPFGQSWRQIRFKCQPALGSLPANSCDVCVLVRSWHVLVILLMYPLQDSKLAILPEMVIKRDRFPDVQPCHDGKAHRIAIAELLVLILLDDRSGPPLVRLFRADNVRASGYDRLQKVPGPVASHAGQDQSMGFSEDKIGGAQEPV